MKKCCTVCGKNKTLSEFNKNPGTKDGKGSQCSRCDIEQSIRRVQEKKRRLIALHGGRCRRCGYNSCPASLVFHHPSGSKEAEISSLMKHSFEEAATEAKKCILLCANCHGEEHYKDYGPLLGNRRKPAGHGTSGMYRKCGPPKCGTCRGWKRDYMRRYTKSLRL